MHTSIGKRRVWLCDVKVGEEFPPGLGRDRPAVNDSRVLASALLCRFSFGCNDDVRFVNNGPRAEKAVEDYVTVGIAATSKAQVKFSEDQKLCKSDLSR